MPSSGANMKEWSPDQRLRAFGFAIHSRPKEGPVKWVRKDIVYFEGAAHDYADHLEQQASENIVIVGGPAG